MRRQPIIRALAVLFIAVAAVVAGSAAAQGTGKATVYKSPHCGCCEEYVAYLRGHGFDVTAVDTEDLPRIKRQHGVPANLEGCHTMILGGYVVEGHVPVGTLRRLLTERPEIRGVSLPGMPAGSPGMSGTKTAPFEIYAITDGAPEIYAVE
jgi:hypothetical protein